MTVCMLIAMCAFIAGIALSWLVGVIDEIQSRSRRGD